MCSGTHGYMAPEVLAKGVAYDSSADWFLSDLLSAALIGACACVVAHMATWLPRC